MRKIAIFILVLLMIVWSVFSTENRVEKRFPVEAGKPVSVDFSDVDGDVFITSHDKNEIYFLFEKTLQGRTSSRLSDYFEEIEPEMSFDSNHLEVDIHWPRHSPKFWFGFSKRGLRVVSHLRVPRGCDLNIRVVDGDIEASGVNGTIYLKTTDGDMKASALNGEVTLKSTDGDITGRKLGGEVSVRCVDGDVEVDQYEGSLTASTTDGEIRVREGKGSLDVHTGDGDIDASGVFGILNCSTGDGDAVLTFLEGSRLTGDCILKSGDGDLRLRVPRGMAFVLEVRTGDGDIRMEDLDFDGVSLQKRNRFRGRRGDGDYTITAQTRDGDVFIAESR
jgi:DUF4097 and DUF4098 domain-containing protein YvlB